MKKPSPAKKLDIFAVIKKIDARNMGYVRIVKTEDRKEFDQALSYPLLRWMSCAENDELHEYYLLAINEMVNPVYFALGKHKDLQYKMLAAIGSGGWTQHKWVPPVKGAADKKLAKFLGSMFEDFEEADMRLWLDINGESGLEELLKKHGVQVADRKEIISEAF